MTKISRGPEPYMPINLRPDQARLPADYVLAVSRAFAVVRREIWDDRESRLRAKWESYG